MASGFCASVMVVMISLKTLNPSVLLGGGPVELVMQFLFVSVAFFLFGVVPRFLWDRSKYGVGLVFGIGSARLSELGLSLVGSFHEFSAGCWVCVLVAVLFLVPIIVVLISRGVPRS